MINTVSKQQIAKTFSEYVDSVAYKYDLYIHPYTMGGSQGEVAKVDMTDGKDVYRVILRTGTDWNETFHADTMYIEVRKYEGVAFDPYHDILWADDGEVLDTRTWYRIGADRYASKLNYLKWRDVMTARRASQRTKGIRTLKTAPEVILRAVRKVAGYKRVKAEDIKCLRVQERCNGRKRYIIDFTRGIGNRGNELCLDL